MEVINLLEEQDKEYWLNKIKESKWEAGKYLCDIISNLQIFQLCGKNTKVMLLTNSGELISFCTFSEMDEIQPTDLTPWIGFVYTFEKYRGNRYAGILINACCEMARKENADYIHLSTNHVGLYEKYGFEFYDIQKDICGNDSRIYRKKLFL